MPRLWATFLAAGLVLHAGDAGRAQTLMPAPIDLLEQYARGDGERAAALLATVPHDRLEALGKAIQKAAPAWLKTTDEAAARRRRMAAATLALDVAHTGLLTEWKVLRPLVEWGCELVRKNPAEQAEHDWQLASVALAGGALDKYLLIDPTDHRAIDRVFNQEKLKSDIAGMSAHLGPSDRLRVLVFDDQIRDVFGWKPAGTLDVAAVMQRVGMGEISAVYDGLVQAMIYRPTPDRRHLVVAMTDGRDGGSVVDSKTVREVARRAESVLHLVMVGGHAAGVPRNAPGTRMGLWPTMPDRDGYSNLNEAAKLTGGRVHGDSLLGRLDTVRAFKAAFDDFRQSYILRYTLTGVARPGWHDVQVQVKKPSRLTIRARRGYFR